MDIHRVLEHSQRNIILLIIITLAALMFHIDHKANKAEVNSNSVSFNTLLLKGAINGR